MKLELEIPMLLPNTLNLREFWATRAKRAQSQRGKATRRLPPREVLPVLIVVRLTRVAPRRLDDDGAVASLKAVRDAVATWLRVDDASPLVRWEYAQARGEPAARVSLASTVALDIGDLASVLPAQDTNATPPESAPTKPRTPRTAKPRASHGYGANVTPNVRRGS